MLDPDFRAGSNTISMNFTDNLGDENHEIVPSCSYKLENDENSCDSGISMSSNCSSSKDLPTSFASLKRTQSIEIDRLVMSNKSFRELSDEEIETEKKLQKRLENASKQPQGLCLADITNSLRDSPKPRNFFDGYDAENSVICRKRSAINYRTHSENFKRRKKADSFSIYEEESENIQETAAKRTLRRCQSSIETSFTEHPLSPEYQQGSEGTSSGHAYRKINGALLIKWMEAPDFSDKYHLIDCRYPYEYNGGHIRGAVNCYDPEKIQSIFYPDDEEAFNKVRTKIPILYCEFSKTRGPNMANRLRSFDRLRNMDHYPALNYEEIYVLENGYRQFFRVEAHREYCEPREYVKMRHSEHVNELKRFSFHKSKSFAGTSVFRNNSRPTKYGRFNMYEGFSSSLSQKSMPGTISNFKEKFEDLASFSDGLNQEIAVETRHFSKLQMSSPSLRSLIRPPTRRAVFPPTITEKCITESEISVIGASLVSSQTESPISPEEEEISSSATAVSTPIMHFDSDHSFVASEGTPPPSGMSIMPLPVPKFS